MEILGIVEHGVVRLPDDARLPDGARVRVLWDPNAEPLEREALREDDVRADLDWASGHRAP